MSGTLHRKYIVVVVVIPSLLHTLNLLVWTERERFTVTQTEQTPSLSLCSPGLIFRLRNVTQS